MKKVSLIVIVLLIIGASIFVVIKLNGFGGKKKIYKEIIDNVEKAYEKASSYKYPTLDEIKQNFSMNGANWIGDQVISDEGLACDIKEEASRLKVVCPNLESQKNMPILVND